MHPACQLTTPALLQPDECCCGIVAQVGVLGIRHSNLLPAVARADGHAGGRPRVRWACTPAHAHPWCRPARGVHSAA